MLYRLIGLGFAIWFDCWFGVLGWFSCAGLLLLLLLTLRCLGCGRLVVCGLILVVGVLLLSYQLYGCFCWATFCVAWCWQIIWLGLWICLCVGWFGSCVAVLSVVVGWLLCYGLLFGFYFGALLWLLDELCGGFGLGLFRSVYVVFVVLRCRVLF